MWYLWEAYNGQLSVVCEMWEMDPWKMRESKEGSNLEVGKRFYDGLVEPVEELYEEVETVRGFCYLGYRVNASGGCGAAVTARARIGWVTFRECGELLNSKRFSLKVKGMVYRSCVRVTMLYGSEIWCLRENEIAIILRRNERAMVRAMCRAKLMEKKEDRGPDGDVGIEGNSGSDGKGKWSEMVRACVEEG